MCPRGPGARIPGPRARGPEPGPGGRVPSLGPREALLDARADPNVEVRGRTVLDRTDLSSSRAVQALLESRGGQRTRPARPNPGVRSRAPRGRSSGASGRPPAT